MILDAAKYLRYETKSRIHNFDLLIILTFYSSKHTVKKLKRKESLGENIVNQISDKGLVSIIYRKNL